MAYPIVLLGILAAGGRATLANSAYTAHEVLFQYRDSRAHLVFAARELVPVVLEMFKLAGLDAAEAKRRIVLCEAPPPTAPTYVNTNKWGAGLQDANGWGSTLSDLVGKGKLQEEEKFEGEDVHETAFLCYSSGTTGKPKGVEVCIISLTWRNVLTLMQCAWLVLVDHAQKLGCQPRTDRCSLPQS